MCNSWKILKFSNIFLRTPYFFLKKKINLYLSEYMNSHFIVFLRFLQITLIIIISTHTIFVATFLPGAQLHFFNAVCFWTVTFKIACLKLQRSVSFIFVLCFFALIWVNAYGMCVRAATANASCVSAHSDVLNTAKDYVGFIG